MEYVARRMSAVTGCRAENGGYAVILDQTPFYEGGGGQPPDQGVIDGIKLIEIRPGPAGIEHILPEPLCIGRIVTCEVNFKRRFSFMQHHTAEHILSGIVFSRYGFRNTGFHLTETEDSSECAGATVDFDGEWPQQETDLLEILLNRAVWQNVPVTSRPARPGDKFRSKKEIAGDIRVVTVAGYDSCACKGSHVNATGEIGVVKITEAKRYKRGMRVVLLCGMKALRDYESRHDLTRGLCSLLSSTEAKLLDRVFELNDREKQRSTDLSRLRLRLFEESVRNWRWFQSLAWVIWDEADAGDLPKMAAALAETTGNSMVMIRREQGGFYAAIVSREGRARELAREVITKHGGQGGGSESLWQGMLESWAEEHVCGRSRLKEE